MIHSLARLGVNTAWCEISSLSEFLDKISDEPFVFKDSIEEWLESEDFKSPYASPQWIVAAAGSNEMGYESLTKAEWIIQITNDTPTVVRELDGVIYAAVHISPLRENQVIDLLDALIYNDIAYGLLTSVKAATKTSKAWAFREITASDRRDKKTKTF